MAEISTSILTVEKKDLVKKLHEIDVARTDYIHIDVMDGKFVPKNTYQQMIDYAKYVDQSSTLPLDVHLMVEDVYKYIDYFADLGPDIITFHLEAVETYEVQDVIDYILSYNCKVGISIKPNTKIEDVLEFLPHVHLVLVMTVEPGLGGQQLIPETIQKVKKLKQYIEEENLDTFIEVDGGINLETIEQVKQAGADIFVVGTAIVNAENPGEIIKQLKK